MVDCGGLVGRLLRQLPEFRIDYERERRWWRGEDPGPHVWFGNVLVPALVRALESRNEEFLRRAFAFLEALALEDSQATRDVVSQSVLEPLADDVDRITEARPYLGPGLLRLVNDIGDFWGIDHASDLK